MMTDLVGRLLDEIKKQRKKIVVCGDVIVDRWIHGCVESCQDGCSKFVQEESIETPGGAANAERSLMNWGVRTLLYGYAQNDCPIKTRYVEDNKIIFRVDNDGSLARGKGYQWSRNLAMEMVQHADGVLLSDYDKGYLTPEFIREVAILCKLRSIPCVADVKREPAIYTGCIIKCNEDYHTRYTEVIEYNRLVVTGGEKNPVVWCDHHVSGLGYDLPPIKCINHVGAGDCFSAHLILALAYGFPLKEAAALAHSAGRVYVQHPHNRPPLPQEIAVDLSSVVM